MHEPGSNFLFDFLLFKILLRRLVSVLVAVDDELRVNKEAVSILRTQVVIRFSAVFQYTTKASPALSALSALDLFATADSFSKIAEFILFVKVYFRGPQSAKLMNVGVTADSC